MNKVQRQQEVRKLSVVKVLSGMLPARGKQEPPLGEPTGQRAGIRLWRYDAKRAKDALPSPTVVSVLEWHAQLCFRKILLVMIHAQIESRGGSSVRWPELEPEAKCKIWMWGKKEVLRFRDGQKTENSNIPK